MTRTTSVALLGLGLAQGCILYEDRGAPSPLECRHGWCDSADTGDETGGEVRNADLRLTLAEGLPDQDVLTNLVNTGPDALDLTVVDRVKFSRDVEVLDLIARTDEVVLLLHVAADADPGAVDVSVINHAGTEWALVQPFTILEADGTTTTCHPGGGGGGTTTTTDDTGCP